MLLSIIIPTYNSAHTIRRCLASIVSQSFKDWEVLIMDGVSKDSTISIAQSFKDSRIKCFSEPDNGIYDAMNKGIKKSHGEWLYFLGSDDWLYDNDVLKNVSSNTSEVDDIIYGNVYCDNLDMRHKGAWTVDLIEWNRCHQAIFYKRTVFIKFGLFSLKYPILSDYDFNLKCFFSPKCKTKFIPNIIAHYSGCGKSSQITDYSFYSDWHWKIYKTLHNTSQKEFLHKCLQQATNEKKKYGHYCEYLFMRTIKEFLCLISK